jgi:hypothetical protein
MTVEEIARVCHEVNRAYCDALGDRSQVVWEEAPAWQRESILVGVGLHSKLPHASPSDSHAAWLTVKMNEGWKYGPVKDVEKKEHPCFVPYEALPKEQKAKDYIFGAVVRALAFPPPERA